MEKNSKKPISYIVLQTYKKNQPNLHTNNNT
nr:MAG TPA: hypothetical protein [Caudoviricetes sp.]